MQYIEPSEELNFWKDYAYEELIAELASAFVCNDLDINSQLENHALYIDSWVQILTDDKKSFFRAAGEARKAANWLSSGGL